jgi:glycerophosphoryl diester phosphodiesterase
MRLLATLLLLSGCAQGDVPAFVEWLPDHPIISAHRGGAHLAPENTFESVTEALNWDAEVMEIDVQRSSDGELMVIHDHSVDRVTGEGNGCDIDEDTEKETFGSVLVHDLTIAELQDLDAGACFTDLNGDASYSGAGVFIPTLRELLDEFPTTRFVVESKDHEVEAAEELLAVLQELDAFDRTCVLDFDDDFITALAERAPPEACIVQPRSGIRCWSTSGLFPVGGGGCPEYDLMWMPHENTGLSLKTDRIVDDIQAAGMPVFMWTLNEGELLAEVLALEVDGVVTDRPDLARQLIGTPWIDGGSD